MRRRFGRDSFFRDRQCEIKDRSPPRLAFEPYLAAMQADQFLHDAQSKARPLALRVPALGEFLKDRLLLFVRNAAARVSNPEDHLTRTVSFSRHGAEADRASLGSAFDRIRDQIIEYLDDPARVGQHLRQARRARSRL